MEVKFWAPSEVEMGWPMLETFEEEKGSFSESSIRRKFTENQGFGSLVPG